MKCTQIYTKPISNPAPDGNYVTDPNDAVASTGKISEWAQQQMGTGFSSWILGLHLGMGLKGKPPASEEQSLTLSFTPDMMYMGRNPSVVSLGSLVLSAPPCRCSLLLCIHSTQDLGVALACIPVLPTT